MIADCTGHAKGIPMGRKKVGDGGAGWHGPWQIGSNQLSTTKPKANNPPN